MIASGMRPTYFGNAPRHTQSYENIVPETQQSNPTPESYPTIESNSASQSKTKKTSRPWKRAEKEVLMRAYINVSEDPIVGNAQPSGIFLLLLLFIVFIVIYYFYCYYFYLCKCRQFLEKSREHLLQHYGGTML